MVPRMGLEPVRLVGLATNTGGVTTPCVYQFHHLGKNNPLPPGGGFFIRILLIQQTEQDIHANKMTYAVL